MMDSSSAVERLAVNEDAAGSNPACPATELVHVAIPVLAEAIAVLMAFAAAYVWIAIYATRMS